MVLIQEDIKEFVLNWEDINEFVLNNKNIKEFVLNWIYFSGYSSVPVVPCVKCPTESPTQGKCFLGNYVMCS